MRYRATNETVPVGLEERREKAVHTLKSGEAQERVTLKRLQPAGGIRAIIMKERLTETIREFGGKPPRPGIAPACTDPSNQRRGRLSCRNAGRGAAGGLNSPRPVAPEYGQRLDRCCHHRHR